MIPLELLQLLVYLVFVFALIAYSTLDGFDLGVGCLHLFAKGDNERRLMINSIGPVWDGNATWIVIGGGVLFAGFPKAFSSIMTAFYTLVMVVIFAFMLRGVAIEFRSKKNSKTWRAIWDFAFFLASFLLAVTIGIILGNLIQGIPIDRQGNFQGGLDTLIRPYPLMIALFALSLFTMHGSIYLLMKTEGKLHDRIRLWVKRLIVIFVVMWLLATTATFLYNFHMVKPILAYPFLIVFPLISFAAIGAIPHFVKKRQDGMAFVASCASIVFLLVLFGIGTFPNILFSTAEPLQNSLTLFNSSGTKLALFVLVIVAISGIPLAFFYGSYIHKVFRGKVKLDHMSY